MWGVYKRHTPFAMVTERMNFQDNLIRIPKKGDLLSYMYLTRTLKSTGVIAPWDSSIINSWKLYIGQELIDTQDSVFSLSVAPQTLARTYAKSTIQSVAMFCPLQFWFCNDLPLPLVALQYDDVTIRLDWTPDPAYYYECYMNFILLGDEEREWFASTAHEISIYQVNKLVSHKDVMLRNPVNYIASAPIKLPTNFTYGIKINGKDLRSEYNSHGAQISMQTEYARVLPATSDPYPPTALSSNSQMIYSTYGIGTYSIYVSSNSATSYAVNLHDGDLSTSWQTAGQQRPGVPVTYTATASSNSSCAYLAFDQTSMGWISNVLAYSGNDPTLSGTYLVDSSTHDQYAYLAFDGNVNTAWISPNLYGNSITTPTLNTFSSSNVVNFPEYYALDGNTQTYWSAGSNYYMDYTGKYTINTSVTNFGIYQPYDGNPSTYWESQPAYGVTANLGTYVSSASTSVYPGTEYYAFNQTSSSWIATPNYGAVVNTTASFAVTASSTAVPGTEYRAFDGNVSTAWESNINSPYGYGTAAGNYGSNASFNLDKSNLPITNFQVNGSAYTGFRNSVLSFTSAGTSTLTLQNPCYADILVIGGGGGGGPNEASAGAGGLVFYPNLYLNSSQSYQIVVGSGGSGARVVLMGPSNRRKLGVNPTATNGGPSSFSNLIADGGGSAAAHVGSFGTYNGGDGGCGGGRIISGASPSTHTGQTTQGLGSTGYPYGFGSNANVNIGGSVSISGALGYDFANVFGDAYTSLCEPDGTSAVSSGVGAGAGACAGNYTFVSREMICASGKTGCVLVRLRNTSDNWSSNAVFGNSTSNVTITVSSNVVNGSAWISNSNIYGYSTSAGLYGSNASSNSATAWAGNWISTSSYGYYAPPGTYGSNVSTGSPSWGPFNPGARYPWIATTGAGQTIDISLPSPTTVYEYAFQLDIDPLAWSIYGSNDASAWTLIESVTGSATSSTEIHRFISPSNYKFFQLRITQTANPVFMMKMFWLLDNSGRPVHPVNMTSSPWTSVYDYVGDAILGTYNFTSSSADIFPILSQNPSSVYFGGTSLTTGVTGYPSITGEWLQVSFPSARVVANVVYAGTPTTVWVVASNNLTNWTLSNTCQFVYQQTSVICNTGINGSFRHWRLIVGSNVTVSAFTITNYNNQRMIPYTDYSRQIYQSSGGGPYTGANSFGGEWIEFSLPVALAANVIAWTPPCPTQFSVYAGSSPTGSFTKIAGPINIVSLDTNTVFTQFTNTTSYLVYRIAISALVVNRTTLRLCTMTGEPLTPPYTAKSFTSAPVAYGTGALGQYAFRGKKADTSNAFNGTGWISGMNYKSDTMLPIADADYLTIDFGIPVSPVEVVITDAHCGKFQLDASTDGFVSSNVSVISPIAPTNSPFTLSGKYRSYRLIFNTSMYTSNVVSVKDIAFYDQNGRINEFCSGNTFVTTSNNLGGNSATYEYLTVTFPSSETVASYTLTSPSMPRSWTVTGNPGAVTVHTVYDNFKNDPPNNFVITSPGSYSSYTFTFTATLNTSNVIINRLQMYTSNGFQLISNNSSTFSSECLGSYVANSSVYSSLAYTPFDSKYFAMNTYYNYGTTPNVYSPGWTMRAWGYQTDLDGASDVFPSLTSTYTSQTQFYQSNILHLSEVRNVPSTGTYIFETYLNVREQTTLTVGPIGAIGTGTWARLWVGQDALNPMWSTTTGNPSSSVYISSAGTYFTRLVLTGKFTDLFFQINSYDFGISNQLGPHTTNNVIGEWVELKLPAAVSITSYELSSVGSSWRLFGTNNYTNWIQIDSNVANTSNIYFTGNKTPFQTLRFVFVNTATDGPLSISKLKLNSANGRINSSLSSNFSNVLTNTFYGGFSINNEFWDVSLPSAVSPTGYTIATNAINWQILVSSDYTNWILVDSQQSQYTKNNYYVLNTSGQYFRLTSNLIGDTSNLIVYSFQLINGNGQPIVPTLTTNSLTMYNSQYYGYQVGIPFTVSSASLNSVATSTLGNWIPIDGAYNADYSNNGSTVTTVDGNDIKGEWVQEYYQFGVTPASYTITGSAIQWVIAVSNDGLTWSTLNGNTVKYIRFIATYAAGPAQLTFFDANANVISYTSGAYGGAGSEWIKFYYDQPISANSLYFSNSSNCTYAFEGSLDGITWDNLFVPIPPLYIFSTFTFTTLGATGANGPSSLSAYGTTYPGYSTPYALTLVNGIQYWTVPETKNYNFILAGAGMTNPNVGNPIKTGYGIVLNAFCYLNAGDVIAILVGQSGVVSGLESGGCGGTFVYNVSTAIPLFVAGGAGGPGTDSRTGGNINVNATLSNTGRDGRPSAPTSAGTGGVGPDGASTGGTTAGTTISDGGAGFNANGSYGNTGSALNVPQSFKNGGRGSLNGVNGGFGGGGSSTTPHGGGGGGGGYGGGGVGGIDVNGFGGGGGGSYDISGVYSGSATNSGQGYVTIT